jgi:hypothetical protein
MKLPNRVPGDSAIVSLPDCIAGAPVSAAHFVVALEGTSLPWRPRGCSLRSLIYPNIVC